LGLGKRCFPDLGQRGTFRKHEVRAWDVAERADAEPRHDYEHEGEGGASDAHAIVLTAQAPVRIWDDVELAALAPLDGPE
jgi:hypothetical protein